MNKTQPQTTASAAQKRRRYDEQFKRDAVALMEGGRSAAQLARELGVSHWNLRDWKRHYGGHGTPSAAESRRARDSAPPANEGTGSVVALTAEVADLRRELEAVQRQRDILKKALAIVAQENPAALRS